MEEQPLHPLNEKQNKLSQWIGLCQNIERYQN